MRIEKSECLEEDEDPIVTILEAETMPKLIEREAETYRKDDRLEPCHGYEMMLECTANSDYGRITFCPGDGGEYTIAEYRLINE